MNFVDHSESLMDLNLSGTLHSSQDSIVRLVKKNPDILNLGLSESSMNDRVLLEITHALSEKVCLRSIVNYEQFLLYWFYYMYFIGFISSKLVHIFAMIF